LKTKVIGLITAFKSFAGIKGLIKGVFAVFKRMPLGRLLTAIAGALSAAVGAWTLYRDKVVDVVGDTQVTIGDYVSAVLRFFEDMKNNGIDLAKE